MPKADAEEEFVENPKSGSRKKKKKAPGTESSSRKPKNEGALVAYDEEKASKAKRDQPQSASRSAAPSSSSRRNNAPPADHSDHISAVSDDDYHDPDDEPRFKYSTAELADSSCRSSRCCLITLAIFCIIVAIVLSIVMVRVFTSQDEENQEPPPTMAPTTAAQATQPGLGLFQFSQSVIEDRRCAASSESSDTCTTACAGFECCDPTIPSNSSCFFYNPDGCLNYQRCHVTSSGIVVPPFNLAEICSVTQISADPTPCREACASVSCCWESNSTCYDKFYTCLDYSECQNLRSTVTVPAATFDVAKYCDTTQAGSLTQTTACEEACSPAECCWSEDEASNCLRSDFLSCLTYYPCGQLDIPGAGNEVTLPPSTIRSDCSITMINTGNTTACEAVCSAGSCCKEGATDDCFLSDPLACLAYEPCVVLE